MISGNSAKQLKHMIRELLTEKNSLISEIGSIDEQIELAEKKKSSLLHAQESIKLRKQEDEKSHLTAKADYDAVLTALEKIEAEKKAIYKNIAEQIKLNELKKQAFESDTTNSSLDEAKLMPILMSDDSDDSDNEDEIADKIHELDDKKSILLNDLKTLDSKIKMPSHLADDIARQENSNAQALESIVVKLVLLQTSRTEKLQQIDGLSDRIKKLSIEKLNLENQKLAAYLPPDFFSSQDQQNDTKMTSSQQSDNQGNSNPNNDHLSSTSTSQIMESHKSNEENTQMQTEGQETSSNRKLEDENTANVIEENKAENTPVDKNNTQMQIEGHQSSSKRKREDENPAETKGGIEENKDDVDTTLDKFKTRSEKTEAQGEGNQAPAKLQKLAIEDEDSDDEMEQTDSSPRPPLSSKGKKSSYDYVERAEPIDLSISSFPKTIKWFNEKVEEYEKLPTEERASAYKCFKNDLDNASSRFLNIATQRQQMRMLQIALELMRYPDGILANRLIEEGQSLLVKMDSSLDSLKILKRVISGFSHQQQSVVISTSSTQAPFNSSTFTTITMMSTTSNGNAIKQNSSSAALSNTAKSASHGTGMQSPSTKQGSSIPAKPSTIASSPKPSTTHTNGSSVSSPKTPKTNQPATRIPKKVVPATSSVVVKSPLNTKPVIVAPSPYDFGAEKVCSDNAVNQATSKLIRDVKQGKEMSKEDLLTLKNEMGRFWTDESRAKTVYSAFIQYLFTQLLSVESKSENGEVSPNLLQTGNLLLDDPLFYYENNREKAIFVVLLVRDQDKKNLISIALESLKDASLTEKLLMKSFKSFPGEVMNILHKKRKHILHDLIALENPTAMKIILQLTKQHDMQKRETLLKDAIESRDISHNDTTPLGFAIASAQQKGAPEASIHSYLAMAKSLLEYGANMNAPVYTKSQNITIKMMIKKENMEKLSMSQASDSSISSPRMNRG